MVCKVTTNIVQAAANVNARQSYRKTSPDVLLYTVVQKACLAKKNTVISYRISWIYTYTIRYDVAENFFSSCANFSRLPECMHKSGWRISLKIKSINGKRIDFFDVQRTLL